MMLNTGRMMPRTRWNTPAPSGYGPLQDVLRQVFVLDDAGQALVDVRSVDGNSCALELGRVKGNVIEQPLHDRIESSRADILLALVDGERYFSQPSHTLGLKIDIDALGGEQGLILSREAGVRRGEDLLEVGNRERGELDADREASLQFGNQIRRLGEMKRAAGDEQNVIGLDHAVFGCHRRALDQRQQVPLHALARNICAMRVLPAGNLVDLV